MLRLKHHTEVIRDWPANGVATIIDLTSGKSALVAMELSSPKSEVPPEIEGFFTQMSREQEILSTIETLRATISELNVMSLTILPTYDCNFGCKYCFSQALRRPVYMSSRVVEALAAWLSDYVERNQISRLFVSFYGGEPLLAKSQLMDILSCLKTISAKYSIICRSTISTNGYFLSQEYTQDLARAGVTSVSITIDGNCQEHDKRRPLSDGTSSWHRVVEGVLNCFRSISTCIRINIDAHNLSAVRSLASDLWDNHPEMYSLVPMYVYPIEKVSEAQGCYLDMSSGQASQVLVRAWRDQIECGIGFRPTYPFGICQFHSPHSFTISPEGIIYRCPGTIGQSNYSLGDLWKRSLPKVSIVWNERCKACKYLFLCGGGCHGTGYVQCRRAFLSTIVPQYMLLRLFSDMKVISC